MLDPLRRLVIRLFRVPPEPSIPAGARVVRVFRAAPSYYRYRLTLWGLRQLWILLLGLGAIVFAWMLAADVTDATQIAFLLGVQLLAVLAFLVQLPISFAVLRLDFDMRWYILMDRSLRIREGIFSVREKTMTFANIQQITIRRNPLQRMLGLADVQVRTAGGGGSGAGGHGGGKNVGEGMHEAFFRGVDNAEEIRSAVRERVRLHRDAGLGDPDEAREPVPSGATEEPVLPGPASGTVADLLAAADELRREVRAWRTGSTPAVVKRDLPPMAP